MGRQTEDYLLRTYPNSPYWHYKLAGWKSYKTTGQRTKAAAKKVALEAWQKQRETNVCQADITFGKFANDFFRWDSD